MDVDWMRDPLTDFDDKLARYGARSPGAGVRLRAPTNGGSPRL